MINPTSLAAGNQVGIKNVQFELTGQVLQRKIVIVGTYDASKTSIADEVPVRVFTEGEVGALYGFGSMLHRLAIKSLQGSKGLETWIVPQAESGTAVVAAGKIALTGPATEDRTLKLYLSGEEISSVDVSNGDVAIDIAAALVAGVTDQNIAASLVINGVNAFEIDFESKSLGPWGNGIDISFNLDSEDILPAGVGATITAMTGGLNNPDIQPALDALGQNDNQNEKSFTAFVHGYGQDATALDAISVYNGEGNDFTGNYSKTVARPFRSLFGDVAADTAGLDALIAFADANLLDRTNGVIAAPGSQSHPEEIAALAMGAMELINVTRAEQSYIDEILSSIRVGAAVDRWTDTYDNRDIAVKAGISPTLIKSGALTLQNVVSFYRPISVPVESNGYRSMRNISILQNLLFNQKLAFEQPKWKQITIVEDVTKVSNTTSRLKARDVDSVLDELLALALIYEGLAWLFSASFTISKLQEGDKVILRPAGNGFDITFPVVLSGEGGILNQVIEFDTSLAVFL